VTERVDQERPAAVGHAAPVARPTKAESLGAAARIYVSHGSAQVLVAQAVVAAGVRATQGMPTPRDALIVGAVAIVWPLQEWFAHKFVLHARPRRIAGRKVDPYVARYHRRHHRDPWDLQYTFLPVWLPLVMIPVNVAAWFALTPTTKAAWTGIAAYGTAAALYEWTHFLTHVSYKPRRWWYRTLQRRHRLHHFKNEYLWLGFTVPFVDDLFRTAPDPSTVEVSPTVRTLGVRDES
jgi:hypothetical protein